MAPSLGIAQAKCRKSKYLEVYLACNKRTALVKLVLHAIIVCSLVAFLASQ